MVRKSSHDGSLLNIVVRRQRFLPRISLQPAAIEVKSFTRKSLQHFGC